MVLIYHAMLVYFTRCYLISNSFLWAHSFFLLCLSADSGIFLCRLMEQTDQELEESHLFNNFDDYLSRQMGKIISVKSLFICLLFQKKMFMSHDMLYSSNFSWNNLIWLHG